MMTNGTRDDMKKFYSQFMGADDLVFDIGANIRDRAELFAELAKDVVAVEPQLACLQGVIGDYVGLWKRFHGTRVRVVPDAAGALPGIMRLYRSPAAITTASLSPRYIQDTQASGRFNKRWEGYEQVVVTTLDALIDFYGVPAFIKIDVEGFEPEVLRGLSQPVKALSFEFTPEVLYMAEEVLAHCQTLGPCTVNYALGNHFVKLEHDAWLSPSSLLVELRQFAGDSQIMGDIYVRWEL